jgi:tuftelin-interacting protein 11
MLLISYTRVPAFVTKKNVEDDAPPATGVDEVEDSASDEEDSVEESEGGVPPDTKDEEEAGASHRPGLGGSGFKNPFAPAGSYSDTGSNAEAGPSTSGGRAGIGSNSRGRGGIGFSNRSAEAVEEIVTEASRPLHGGLGSSTAPINPIVTPAPATNVPSAFGRSAANGATSNPVRPKKGFLGRETVTPIVKSTLTATDAAHLANIGGTFGAKMLQNMGWSAGEGLGKDRAGRATPIQVGKVLKGQGLQSGMRTEDSKREARRRGDVISDDEDDKPKRRGAKKGQAGPSRQQPDQDQSWKKQKKVKVRVEHKTYEQLLAEAGDNAPSGVGLVLDARGGDVSALIPLVRELRPV